MPKCELSIQNSSWGGGGEEKRRSEGGRVREEAVSQKEEIQVQFQMFAFVPKKRKQIMSVSMEST